MVDTAAKPLSLPTSSAEWNETIHGLHRAAQPLGALRQLVLDRVPNYLELSLTIRPEGLSTGPLPGIGQVVLDFQRCALVHDRPDIEPAAIPLEGQSQGELLESLLTVLDVRDSLPLAHTPQGTRTDSLLAALAARHHPFAPQRQDLAAETPVTVDRELSFAYSQVLYRMFTASARFRARLTGPMTPVVVWPEHFDLSFLWFATPQADDNHPHMNFGFAPFSDDIERPYLYAYAYPMPEGFEQLPLPPGAGWHVSGWQGMVYPSDALASAADPEAAVEDIFTAVYDTLAPFLTGNSTGDR